MKDHNGKDIVAGDYVRHVCEPAHPKADVTQGLGRHCHNFFGVAQVSELMRSVVVVEPVAGGGVYLGALLEVVDGQVCNRPYLVPVGVTLREMKDA